MTAPTSAPPPLFSAVDTTSTNGEGKDDVESPSLSDSNALARFEFEAGRSSKDGTKILMVEWEDDEITRHISGKWHISRKQKSSSTVLPAQDRSTDEHDVNRLYFLLPPGVDVPPTVILTHIPSNAASSESTVWRTNPLPAIFPPELGTSARLEGKKGVLHTIWAKKRLQVLQCEVEAEKRRNTEGVGLQMALQEREWIEQNFGVVAKPTDISLPAGDGAAGAMKEAMAVSPKNPRSPSGRLVEKPKGLKLGTSETELSGRQENGRAGSEQKSAWDPLSPESSDVAVSSFGAFAAVNGVGPPALATKSAQSPAVLRKAVPQRPPASVMAQQRQNGISSLDAFAGGTPRDLLFSPASGTGSEWNTFQAEEEDNGDELFALPMSPRSPEMAKSPFSFGREESMKLVNEA
ncbi:hypothetical protein B0A49_07704 [Cryomyces minteri]|uniref:Uncharacterized protein n=1 Tax=Cryomyces minteri TaxID=331657 RepID=A0A4U0WT92_9PEZI|nr:hypothetical protein B0A49_07704 [Cryomyces minteri]